MSALKQPVSALDARFCFAGIGSRKITDQEAERLTKLCAKLASIGGWCYSGNAPGSDIACERGAGFRSTAWLPWGDFEQLRYNPYRKCGDVVVAGDGVKGRRLALEHIKGFASRSEGVKKLLCRDVYQILGDKFHPRVAFVLCCADPQGDSVAGGTGHAVGIANIFGVPVVNLRGTRDEALWARVDASLQLAIKE